MIERISLTDIKEVLEVINTSNREAFRTIIPKKYFLDPVLSTKQFIKEFERYDFFSYKIREKIVGIAALEIKNTTGIINWVYVQPKWQRKGIGTSLVKYLEKKAKKSGLNNIQLVTIEKAEVAISFYKKLGYRSVRHMEREWGLDVVMMKEL